MKLTELDVQQIAKHVFDEQHLAQRVVVVNSPWEQIPFPTQPIQPVQPLQVGTVTPIIERIEVPVIVKEFEIKTVEIPVVVPEVKVVQIEVPKVIIETRIEKVEVPVFIKEFEIKEIEKPVIVTQKEIVKEEFPNWLKFTILAQTTITFLLILIKFLK